MQDFVAYLVLYRSDETGLMSGRHENVLYNICCRGLAVCTGNTEKLHLALGVTEPCGAHLSVEETRILRDYLLIAET